jgi:hypothetical protein
MLIFALLFVLFALDKSRHRDAFRASQALAL